MADAAHGVERSTLVSTSAQQTDFGIRVSGMGDRWFTAPPSQPLLPASQRRRQPRHRRQHYHRTAGIGARHMAAAPPSSPSVAAIRRHEATLEM
jgi:hypothetical protein